MTDKEMIAKLQDHCLEHYEQGGHWLYETYDEADFLKILYICKGDMDEAIKECEVRWKLLEDYSNDLKNS